MKLAIIDVDGVCANNTEREALALEATSDGKIDWPTFFDPKLVARDLPIEGAQEALDELEKAGYQIVFLTGRPEVLRNATNSWLLKQGLNTGGKRSLIMKNRKTQFVRTANWKAKQVKQLVEDLQPEEVLFVDDEIANIELVQALHINGMVTKLSL